MNKSHLRRAGRFILSVSLLTASARVFAQSPGAGARAVSFGLGGGLTTPTSSDYSDFAQTGWNAGGYVQWRQPNQVFGLRGELQYHRTGMKDSYLQTFPQYTTGTTGNLSILHLGGAGVMEVEPKAGGMGWFLLAGLGTYGIRFETSIDNGVSASYTDNKVGFNAGGGLKFRAGTANLFVDARWHSVKDGDATFSFIPITFGIAW